MPTAAVCCPIDGTPLRELEYEGVVVRTCPACGGELVPGDALAHIVRTRHEIFSDAERTALADRTPIAGVPIEHTQRQLRSPLTGEPMRVINYAGDSGIFVDRCPTTGAIWLDRDELERIQVLMESWQDAAPESIKAISGRLESARRNAARAGDDAFQGSRFAFVNALMNRFLDAA